VERGQAVVTDRCTKCGRLCWLGSRVKVGLGVCHELVNTFGKRECELAALVVLKEFGMHLAGTVAVLVDRTKLTSLEKHGLERLEEYGWIQVAGDRVEPSGKFWERVGLHRKSAEPGAGTIE